MKIYTLIFLIILSACNTDLKNPNISFETIPEKAQIGFPINHKVVINDLGELFTLDSVAWEDSSAWLSDSSKVIIKESNIDTLNNSILLNYQITFWDTGSVAIPPLYAFVSFPDSLEASICLISDFLCSKDATFLWKLGWARIAFFTLACALFEEKDLYLGTLNFKSVKCLLLFILLLSIILYVPLHAFD